MGNDVCVWSKEDRRVKKKTNDNRNVNTQELENGGIIVNHNKRKMKQPIDTAKKSYIREDRKEESRSDKNPEHNREHSQRTKED